MRVAIITLPLHTNYGGILQAYALKKSIEALGHSAEVIDRRCKMVLTPSWKMPLVYLKRVLLNLKPGGPEIFRERRILREFPIVSAELSGFVADDISPRLIDSYTEIGPEDYDALVVGSDQVWRPKYFGKIEDAFLDFASLWDVRRVAYAASFGTDHLEYEYEQLYKCSSLLSSFDAVSVREATAVQMCDEWFDREDAVHVLDPVMLLTADHYASLAGLASARPCKGKILSYVLDADKSKKYILERVEAWLGAESHNAYVADRDRNVPLEKRLVPSIQQWLSCFADAEFVVTDSFHGCVLSVLFHKPFIALANPGRGMSRILSLLETLGLDDRIVQGLDPDDDGEYYLSGIDWEGKVNRFSEKCLEVIWIKLR